MLAQASFRSSCTELAIEGAHVAYGIQLKSHESQKNHIIMGFYLVSKDFPSEVFQHRWESFWHDEVLLVPR
jgi:hypothetical protein